MIGPKDFKPFSAEISLCECALCREVQYATRKSMSAGKAAAGVLLAALKDGTHKRMTLKERAEEAKIEKAAAIKAAAAAGASPAHLAIMERGYVKVSMRDFYATGMGLGMTPRTSV